MKHSSSEAALARSKIAFHDYSRTISKIKPKIRTIHLVEPEIIKTTVQEFQELVQRLTGKPVGRNEQHTRKPRAIKVEGAGVVVPVLHEAQRMKIEVEEMYGAEDQTVFASFIEDMDGFFHDTDEFPLFSFRPSQINIFGELPLC